MNAKMPFSVTRKTGIDDSRHRPGLRAEAVDIQGDLDVCAVAVRASDDGLSVGNVTAGQGLLVACVPEEHSSAPISKASYPLVTPFERHDDQFFAQVQ